MAFVKLSDEEDSVDLTIFPKVYEKYPDIKKGNILLVSSKVERRYEKYQLIVNNINILK